MRIKFALCLFLAFIGSYAFSQDNKKEGPISVCYVEVNQNNPLNIGSYTLETSGKQLFDVGIIFAANLNYDFATKRAYLYSNASVAKALTNAQTYIKPLQDKGIKILLDVLGNHYGAGISNFSTREEAADFARQLANTVYTYGLDGIDFDDEYADYGKNNLPGVNSSSFMMLLQELKKVMPDKLITFYYLGEATKYLTLGDSKAGEYINYSWYGYYSDFKKINVPGLQKENISPTAVWIADGKGSGKWNTATSVAKLTELAKDNKDGGYGVFMWFDLRGLDLSSYLSAGSNVLYNENTKLTDKIYSWQNNDTSACLPPSSLQTIKIKGSGATLKWESLEGQKFNIDYRVAVDKDLDKTEWINLATNYKGNTFTIEDKLLFNTNYEWRILSVCPNNQTSTYMFSSVFNSGNGCEIPSNLQASNFLGNSTILNWEKTNAKSFNLLYKKASDVEWISISGITTNSIQLKELEPNTQYNWKIQSICENSSSTFSEVGIFNSGLEKVVSPGRRSMLFQNWGGYLDAGQFNLSGEAITYEGWVRPVRFQNSYSGAPISSVIGIENGDANTALLRFGDAGLANNKLQFVISINGNQQKLSSEKRFYAPNWYHIAATFDGKKMRIYIGGKLDAEKEVIGSFIANGTLYLAGNGSKDRRFSGYLDEFRVWNKALTEKEISDFRCNVSPEAEGLEAYWRMNEGSGPGILDETKNTHYALIVGSAVWNTNIPKECEKTLSTDEQEYGEKEIQLYPNPIKRNQELTIKSNNPVSLEVSFYDMSGRLVKKQTINRSNNTVQMHNLSVGTYLYKIISLVDSNVLSTGKIIVQ